MSDNNEIENLRAENQRLKALLEQHGIRWDAPEPTAQPEPAEAHPESPLSPQEKVALFRSLFRGREDVYPVRWQSANGKSGYSPACKHEWEAGVCGKPRIKCADCTARELLPVTDQVIFDHLSGRHTVGVYPLLPDETCRFLAVDFDEAEWRDDVLAFAQSCDELEIPVAVEISRSGQGAHAWLFFSEPVSAREARRLGSAILSHTCRKTRQLRLSSYDRLFPNQDTLPKGGFGNLIAMPLQIEPRARGCSVFVNREMEPFPDQWAFLAGIHRMGLPQVEAAVLRASGGTHPLDVAFPEEDETPWSQPATPDLRALCSLPESLRMVVSNGLYFEKEALPQPLLNRFIRLAAFQNPEFYQAQAMRFPVWNKPRIIGCAENFPKHIRLPRGCEDAVRSLCSDLGIRLERRDERTSGIPISTTFRGELHPEQSLAVETMMLHETGVLCAPTAFGKTVMAAAIIARRQVSTLILVHRAELLRQWAERLASFLDLPEKAIGQFGSGKHRLTGVIDIALIQSISPQTKDTAWLRQYGQIVVDECHHLSAFTFENVMKAVHARYVLGLTATPLRRDGHHPIIFMQCGPIRHRARGAEVPDRTLKVWPREYPCVLPEDLPIQDVFQKLVEDETRNQTIVADIVQAYGESRKILVLSERTEHLAALKVLLEPLIPRLFILHGRLPRKEREKVLEQLPTAEHPAPFVLLATGRLIGEGFDHPLLDTLALAMPISWKGTLQQYAGRLHREHAAKNNIRIYDYVESGHLPLARMWKKRMKGYQAMGYRIIDADAGLSLWDDLPD
jgi:superfamily II DNA or RNA helicase